MSVLSAGAPAHTEKERFVVANLRLAPASKIVVLKPGTGSRGNRFTQKRGTGRGRLCLAVGQSCGSSIVYCFWRSSWRNYPGAVVFLIGFLERCVVRFRLLVQSFHDQHIFPFFLPSS